MNDEIKEILDKLDYLVKNEMCWWENYTIFSPKDTKLLLDYITNLQQANERLRNHIQMIPYLQTVRQRDDYKSRCEKASDKIQYIIDYGFDYDGFNTVESLKGLIDMLVDYARESKNILQNGSENDG